MTNTKQFLVDFDGAGLEETFSLDELFFDNGADTFLTRNEVDAMITGQEVAFGGGAQPIGTITRVE